jgi:spermine/spermidine synthase
MLVACSILSTEIVLTRVFSVMMWYHFAFLAVSVSLFGLGLGGLFLHVLGKRLAGREDTLIASAAVGYGITTAVLMFALLSMKLGTFEMSIAGLSKLALVYLLAALPFFCGGMFVSLMLRLGHKQAGKVYLFDLVGAGLGCLLTIPLLKLFGGPAAILVSGALGVAGGMVASEAWRRPARLAAGVATAAALLTIVAVHIATGSDLLEPRYTKGNEEPDRLAVAWNSFSRVIAFARPEIGDIMLEIDGIAHTPITPFDGDTAKTQVPSANLQRLPFILRPKASVLIFGSGGGEHILTAMDAGATDIVGVEYNPIVVDMVENRFADVAGGLFQYPGVEVVIDEGRSYIRRANRKFDVIQFTLIDTWAATAAGAFTLSENNVFTVQSMHEYMDHLRADGVISIKRWFEAEEVVLRLMALGKHVLVQRGVTAPEKHFFIARNNEFANMMIKNEPFTLDEMGDLVEQCAKMNLTIVYSPYHEGEGEAFKELAMRRDMDAWYAEQSMDLTPPTDNRPFLFYTLRLRDLPQVFSQAYSAKIHNIGPLMLFVLLGLVLVFVVTLMIVPGWLMRDREAKPPKTWALYFAALGLAYLMVELAMMAKFILYLGHPTYALAVVLFTFLISSGLGAWASERIYPDKAVPYLRAIVGALALYAAVFLVISPVLFHATLAMPLPTRITIAVLAILPLGFMMGVPFPLGVRQLGYDFPGSVPWMYAVNSAASVLGSVAAMLLAVHFGFSSAITTGLALYIVAAFLL